MKTYSVVFAAIALLTSGGLLNAAERFTLQTKVYRIGEHEVRAVEIPEAVVSRGTHHVLFGSPATVQLGATTLSLEGGRLRWNGGDAPPEEFDPIATPVAVLPTGKPVTLVSAAAVEYIEKSADGAFQVREIPRDSPDAPHYEFTFAVEQSEELRLKGEVNVAAFSGRDPVPGLSLNVGKPLVTRMRESFDVKVNDGEWSGLLLQDGEPGDSGLLVLMKLVAAQAGRLMTAAELDRFVTYYYRDPQPDRVGRAIESLARAQFLEDRRRAFVCVGFFSAIFARNPERVGEWSEVIERRGQDRTTRLWLRRALEVAKDGHLDDTGPDAAAVGHINWGRFFASGDSSNLAMFVDDLKRLDEPHSRFFGFGADAALSLAYFGSNHPAVREALASAREKADPRTREWIDALLTEKTDAVIQKVRDRSQLAGGVSDRPRDTIVGAGFSGPRDAGYFGAINPQREMGTTR